jgi:isocitrate dehydrogenase (NAD+)
MHKVAVINGDGIGPEITESTVKIIEASGAKIEWIETPVGQQALSSLGASLPWDSIRRIQQIGVVLKAPLIAEKSNGGVRVEADGEIRNHPSINNGLRREFSMFANLRPIKGVKSISGQYQDLDILIVREITEDMYCGLEERIDDNCAIATKRITRSASQRVARFACDTAIQLGRKRVSAIHKANVLHLTDGLFLESVRSVVLEYKELEFSDLMVDATCYHLIKSPKMLDVMVLPNQYGDIISDVAAGLVGSMGLAPGANIGPQVAMFEAAHGAAPDIAGKQIANPIGLVLSGAMLLDHIGEREAAERVRRGVTNALNSRQWLTPDLGGTSTTRQLTEGICRMIEEL